MTTASRSITRLEDADDLDAFFDDELELVRVNRYDPHPLNASDAFNQMFDDHPQGGRFLAAGDFIWADPVVGPSGPSVIGSPFGRCKITVDAAMPLTAAAFRNPTVPTDRTTRTDGPYRFVNLDFDGSGRVYPKYLSDPATGLPILDPATDPTRNPAYSTKGYAFLLQKVNGYEFDHCRLHGHESLTVYDQGCAYGHVHHCEFFDGGKIDDIASAILASHYGSLRIVRSITNANPGVLMVDNGVGSFAEGQQFYLENVQALCGIAIPDGVYTMKALNVNKDTFELWSANGSAPIDTTAAGTFRHNVRATVTSLSYTPSVGTRIHHNHLHDLKRIAISFHPKGGGACHDNLIERVGESGIHAIRMWDSKIYGNHIDGVELTDVTAFGMEIQLVAGLEVWGNETLNTDDAGISVVGAVDSSFDHLVRNPCVDPQLRYPYGPGSERYETFLDPPPDGIAGEIVQRFKAGTFARLANFRGMDLGIDFRLRCVDDRGVTTTDSRIWVGKSGDSNLARNLRIHDCDFTHVTLPPAPASAPTAALHAGAGNPKESRSYAVAYVVGTVEGPLGPWSNMVTPDGTNGNPIDITAIPIGPDPLTTARKVYGRSGAPATEAGGTPGLVATLADNTTTVAQDDLTANALASAAMPAAHIWYVNKSTDPALNHVRGCAGHASEGPVTLFHTTRPQTAVKEFDFGFTPSEITVDAQILTAAAPGSVRKSFAQISRNRDGVTAPTTSGWGNRLTIDLTASPVKVQAGVFGPGVAIDIRDGDGVVINKATVYAWTDRGVQLSWGTPPTVQAKVVLTGRP